MNLLIMSPGRRAEIVEYFKEVFHKDGGKVFTLDMSEYAPALYMGDDYFRIDKDFNHLDSYIKEVISICIQYEVDAVITLIDPELVLLAQYEDDFTAHGIKLILSDIAFIKSTFNKFEFYNKFKNTINLVDTVGAQDKALELIASGKWSYPIFAKLRDGSASMGIRKIGSEVDMADIKANDKYIYQPFIKCVEYGVDAYFDIISGELVSVFIKHKLAMRAGETDKSISVKFDRILNEVQKTANISGIKGPIDIDVFVADDGEIFINEINPRFGGGYPHAYRCGVNFMQLIMNNIKGVVNKPCFNNYEEGIVLLKYNSSIIMPSPHK